MTKDDVRRRYRRYLGEERDAAAVYRAMAQRSEGESRQILLGLADAEDRHARHWQQRLAELGDPQAEGAAPGGGWRARLLALIARVLGVRAVIPLLERGEAAELQRYDGEPAAPDSMVVEERVHARTVASLFPTWRTRTSGSLRAATFGVNDGLVSNLAIVVGVAAGGASDQTILLAGLAGLLGGGLSMGIGEWISVTSQRELWDGEVELDAEHVRALPEDGANELALLLRAKGTDPEEAQRAARSILRDEEAAVRLLASEKLGFDPRAIGSPWNAALANFGAFVCGAAVPVVPYALSGGAPAMVAAVAASGVALFLVGAAISLITYRPTLFAGLRQLAVGALAAVSTYALGTLVGGVIG